MIPKPQASFFSRHQILLPSSQTKVKWSPKKNKFYCHYLVGGKSERRYLDGETEEAATAEREVLFTRLCMAGARRRGEKTVKVDRRKRIIRDKIDPDYGIQVMSYTVHCYKVVIDKKYIGMRKTKAAAAELRDRYLEERRLVPCATCGKRPEFYRSDKTHWGFRHVEDGCLNIVKLRRVGKKQAAKLWNIELFKQQPFEI